MESIANDFPNCAMDVQSYFSILSEKKGWLIRRNNVNERLDALAKISEIGDEKNIWRLLPYLKDKNREIQIATCETISKLFGKIKGQSSYYSSLRHCHISLFDIDFFQSTFTGRCYVDLLLIASLNSSGYIRERAVAKLSTSNCERAIQFITYRLGDWVPQVRRAAFVAIEKFKRTEHIDALINNLSNFEWLKKVERVDLVDEYRSIVQYIVVENGEYVRARFNTFPEKIRLLLARHLADSSVSTGDNSRLFLKDANFLIRLLATHHFEYLSKEDVEALLNDKSSRVRLQTLYKLQKQNGFVDLLKSYLADTSARIRQFARYALKNEISDFARIYNDNLEHRRDVIGSLSGLAEVGGKQFFETVESFLHADKIKTRKAAFLALTKLNEQRAYEFAVSNLDNEFSGIRNVASRFLEKRVTPEVLERARSIYESGQFDLKKQMLNLFSRIGGWAVIPDIILGTVDENENIRAQSLTYLTFWRAKATRLFIRPKPGELERAKEVFKFAFELHENRQYFRSNPLQGLDFYFR